MSLFTERIHNWDDWGRLYQSIPAFAPLAGHILKKEGLPPAGIENLSPGTNAVFKAGGYVVKIFAPAESGIDQTSDLETELFALRRANIAGVSAPKLTAHGVVEDKYRFAYMITEYIEGAEFGEALKSMTANEKINAGRRLRVITDKMNTPCEPFNNIDVINDTGRYRRWDNYPDAFKKERLAYITSRDFGPSVFVHGDLCEDNILVSPDGELTIIDFADAVLAPVIYEHVLVAIELFSFDPALLRGYFGDCKDYKADKFIEMCFDGLLLHDFGGDIVKRYVGGPDELQRLEDLRKKLLDKLEGVACGPSGK